MITPPPVDEAARAIFNKERYSDLWDGQAERSNEAAGNYARRVLPVAISRDGPWHDHAPEAATVARGRPAGRRRRCRRSWALRV